MEIFQNVGGCLMSIKCLLKEPYIRSTEKSSKPFPPTCIRSLHSKVQTQTQPQPPPLTPTPPPNTPPKKKTKKTCYSQTSPPFQSLFSTTTVFLSPHLSLFPIWVTQQEAPSCQVFHIEIGQYVWGLCDFAPPPTLQGGG